MKAINASSSSSTWLADGSLQTQAEDKLTCLQLLINAGASVLSQVLRFMAFYYFMFSVQFNPNDNEVTC